MSEKNSPDHVVLLHQTSSSNLLIYITVVNANAILSENATLQIPFWINGLPRRITQVLLRRKITELLNSRN